MPGHYTFHGGSTLFMPFADFTGLKVDQVNFVLCQWLSLVLSVCYFKFCPKTAPNRESRLLGFTALGLLMCFFCYGYSIKHLILDSICCYLILCWSPTKYVHKVTFIFAMAYLSFIHFYRIYHAREYSVDVTGPMMIFTQKVTSLAFSLHDGAVKQEAELTPIQKRELVRDVPTALEFFCYVYNYMGVLCGPLCFFADFISFIDAKNFYANPKKKSHSTNPEKHDEEIMSFPGKIIETKLRCTVLYMAANLPFLCQYPLETIVDLDASIFVKFWWAAWDVFLVRNQYYYAWTMADCVNNAAGFGFNGYNEVTGEEKWDLISNIDVWKVETANNLRDCLEGWNKGTMYWLRRVAYERTPKAYRTVATYATSAWWHGFFPGYYVTFLSGALFTEAARTGRRHIRPYMINNASVQMVYDCVTFLMTRLSIVYLGAPFIMLHWWPTLRFYSQTYFSLHIGAAVLLFLLPRFLKKSNEPYPNSANANGHIDRSKTE